MPPDLPHELEQHRGMLMRLARELVRGEAAAEDLVQESFVRALERPPRSAATARAWLARVLHRLALNRVRASTRAVARERHVARAEHVPPPDEALASLELQERLVAVLKSLEEPYRTTLWLRFHEELAPAEIAASLGASARTIESRLVRGLALVRAELDRRTGGDRTRWLGGVLALARDGARLGSAGIGAVAMKKLLMSVVCACVLGVAWRVARSPRSDVETGDAVVKSALESAPLPRDVMPAGERVALPMDAAPTSRGPGRAALRIDVRWSDGTPAPDVGLFVFADDDPLGARRVVRTRTDAAGTAFVADLHPGALRVLADRGAQRSLDAAPGVETRVTLELAVGIDVEGTVTDGNGAPVMDADVLLVTSDEDWLATRVVARTGISGSFLARALTAEHSLSARGGTFAPARLVPLAGKASPGGVARVDLVLFAPALALRGIVLDPSRRPVPHALVACGDPQGLFVSQAGTYWAERGMTVVETGSDGRFEARSILPTSGGLACAVLAESFPIWSGSVGDDLGETSFLEVVLVSPATLAGIVRDATGEPVAGANVRTVVAGDLRALNSPFPLPEGRTDAAGRYQLDLAAPGPVVLRVDPPQGSSLGCAVHADVLAPGINDRDLVLPADDVVRGRAEDWLGRPLIDRVVRVCAVNGSSRLEPRTDAKGRFAITGCDDPPYAVDLLDESGRTPVISLRDVGPSSAEIVLRLSLPASLAGEIAGAGTPGENERAKVALEPRAGIHWPVPEWREGRFVFENIQPGSYRVHARAGERLLVRSGWIALAPGELVDVGVLRVDAPGALVVEFESWPASFSASVRGPDMDVQAFLEPGERGFGVDALAPGEWWLDVDGAGMAGALEPFTVRPDETTRVRVALEPGVARTLSFPSADPASLWNELAVRVRGNDGRLHLGATRERDHGGGSVLVRLPPGTFTVEAETDTGLVARGTFDVLALAPQDAALIFELR